MHENKRYPKKTRGTSCLDQVPVGPTRVWFRGNSERSRRHEGGGELGIAAAISENGTDRRQKIGCETGRFMAGALFPWL